MFTLWYIVVVWTALFGLGIPLAWLLRGSSGSLPSGPLSGTPAHVSDHLLSPFLGMAAVVLILVNLVYLDIPVGRVTPFLWAGILLLWAVLLRRADFRVWLRGYPRAVFLAALAVYLVHGFGLLLVGAQTYAGRGWLDGFHYVTISEFFQHWPFSTAAEDVGRENLFLAWSLTFKTDRIGQSVLQAFFACSCQVDAKPLFGVTILLLAPLTVLAIYALAQRIRLPSRLALLTAVGAGLSPALAVIHLDCFLSQALATPLLLLFPAELEDFMTRPGWRPLLRTSLLLAAAGAIYTEILPLFWGLVCLTAVVHLIRWPIPWAAAVRIGRLVVLSLALNPVYFQYFMQLIRRASAAGACFDTYPINLENWSRLWFGDLAVSGPEWVRRTVQAFTIGLAGLGYLGLIWACRRNSSAVTEGRPGWSRNLGVLALVVIPLVVLLKDDQHPYAFYKLSMSIMPLLILGLAVLTRVPARRSGLVSLVLCSAVWIGGAVATVRMARAVTRDRPEAGSQASLMHGLDMRYLQSRLEATRGQDLLLAVHNHYVNGWLTYHGRNNRVHWLQPHPLLEKHGLGGLATERGGDIVVTCGAAGFEQVDAGDMALDWQGTLFRLWRAHSPHWAVPVVQVHVQSDQPGTERRPPSWNSSNATRLELLAGSDGCVTLSSRIGGRTGPGRVQVYADGQEQELTTYGDTFEVTVPVKAGLNQVWLWHADGSAGASAIHVFGMTRPLRHLPAWQAAQPDRKLKPC